MSEIVVYLNSQWPDLKPQIHCSPERAINWPVASEVIVCIQRQLPTMLLGPHRPRSMNRSRLCRWLRSMNSSWLGHQPRNKNRCQPGCRPRNKNKCRMGCEPTDGNRCRPGWHLGTRWWDIARPRKKKSVMRCIDYPKHWSSVHQNRWCRWDPPRQSWGAEQARLWGAEQQWRWVAAKAGTLTKPAEQKGVQAGMYSHSAGEATSKTVSKEAAETLKAGDRRQVSLPGIRRDEMVTEGQG